MRDTSTLETNGPVYALAADNFDDLYVGGQFTSPGTNLLFTDFYGNFQYGDTLNGLVRAIAFSGLDTYVGGSFTNASGLGANFVAKLANGAIHWSPLGNSVNNSVYAMSVRGTDIFVGGQFTQSGALGVNHIARWDTLSQTWANLGSGADNSVNGLATDNNFVYAGGDFLNAGNKPSAHFGRWGQVKTFLPLILK